MKLIIKEKIKGFTFIELVISISILAILAILGFISYTKNLEDSRDSQRVSDFTSISSALKLHKTQRGNYPLPGASFNIVNSGTLVAMQGKFDKSIIVSNLDKIPQDPFVKIPYTYSVWKNTQEFQIAATLENNGILKALVGGDYNSPSKNIVPTIVLALSASSDIEVNSVIGSGAYNRTKFIFNNSRHNIPYIFEEPYFPYSDNTSFSGLLNDPNVNYLQQIDFKNCNDIIVGEKSIGTGEYQINNYGTLESITCGASLIPKSCKEVIESNSGALSGEYQIMPEGINRSFTGYCDMSTASGGWTLVAKDGNNFNYSIGQCTFANPPTTTTKEDSFIYWACDLDQSELLFWTPSGYVVGTNKVKEDCSTRATKTNNNTCSWTGASQTFQITQSGGCMSGIVTIANMSNVSNWLWWKGADWGTGVTKNLSFLTTTLSGSCYGVEEYTSYCSLFDIYDNVTGSGIGQGWGYRAPGCGTFVDGAISPTENHLIFVR